MIRTAILGASGYVGGELLRLIAAHLALAPVKLFGESKAGQKLGAVHPHLAPAFPDVVVERFDEAALEGIDLVFAALPHSHSQKVAAAILDRLLHHATVLSITGDSYRMRRHRDAIASLRPAITGRPQGGEFPSSHLGNYRRP